MPSRSRPSGPRFVELLAALFDDGPYLDAIPSQSVRRVVRKRFGTVTRLAVEWLALASGDPDVDLVVLDGHLIRTGAGPDDWTDMWTWSGIGLAGGRSPYVAFDEMGKHRQGVSAGYEPPGGWVLRASRLRELLGAERERLEAQETRRGQARDATREWFDREAGDARAVVEAAMERVRAARGVGEHDAVLRLRLYEGKGLAEIECMGPRQLKALAAMLRPAVAEVARDWRAYEGFVVGNGSPLDELLAHPATVFENAPLALIQCAAEAQVGLLKRLVAAGLLNPVV